MKCCTKSRAPALGLAFAVLAGAAGCAAGEAAIREPRLTNPPRKAAWHGEAGEADDREVVPERKYEGSFRLPLAEDWTWDLPDDGRWAVSRLELGTPAVSGDRVLVGSSRTSGLFVLERSSGRLVGRVDTQGPVQAPPTRIEGGWLLGDTFGELQRLDDDLKPVWPEPYAAGGAIYRSPVLLGDTVLVATGGDTVVAVGIADGKWRWGYARDVPRGSQELAILGAPAPVVVGDEVVAGFSDGQLVGIEPGTGRELWSVRVGDGRFPDIQAEALVEGDVLVAAAFGGPVIGLDLASREIRWTVEEAAATSTMTLAGGSVYTSDTQGRVRCIDARTGDLLWTFDVPEAQFSTPVRVGGSILVGDSAGTLYALDRFEGKQQWKFAPMDGSRPAGVAAAPLVAGRQLLFPTAGGRLWSLIADPGAGTDDSEEPAVRPDRVLGW